MAVRIRLARFGRKKRPFYCLVVTDQRAPRDGMCIEQIGTYNPMTDPAEINVKEDRALYWLFNGAQPSETAKALFVKTGVWEKFLSGKKQ